MVPMTAFYNIKMEFYFVVFRMNQPHIVFAHSRSSFRIQMSRILAEWVEFFLEEHFMSHWASVDTCVSNKFQINSENRKLFKMFIRWVDC